MFITVDLPVMGVLVIFSIQFILPLNGQLFSYCVNFKAGRTSPTVETMDLHTSQYGIYGLVYDYKH